MTLKQIEKNKISYEMSPYIRSNVSIENRPKLHEKLVLTSIKMPRDVIDFYDKLVQDGLFSTRSEALRYALRAYIDFFTVLSDMASKDE